MMCYYKSLPLIVISVHRMCMFSVEFGLHIVLIGLGGGGLPMFLRKNIKVGALFTFQIL